MMHINNQRLYEIMQEHQLSVHDVALELGIAPAMVEAWMLGDGDGGEPMPESELRLLQFGLMTENKRYHLF